MDGPRVAMGEGEGGEGGLREGEAFRMTKRKLLPTDGQSSKKSIIDADNNILPFFLSSIQTQGLHK